MDMDELHRMFIRRGGDVDGLKHEIMHSFRDMEMKLAEARQQSRFNLFTLIGLQKHVAKMTAREADLLRANNAYQARARDLAARLARVRDHAFEMKSRKRLLSRDKAAADKIMEEANA